MGNAGSEVSCECLTAMTDEQPKKLVPQSDDPPNLLDFSAKDPLRET